MANRKFSSGWARVINELKSHDLFIQDGDVVKEEVVRLNNLNKDKDKILLTLTDTRENPLFADVTCEGRCALTTVLGGRVEVMEIPSISAAVDHAAETLVREDRRYKRRFIASHTKGKDNKPVKQQARSVLFFDADYGLGDQRTTPKKEKKGKPATHDPFLDPEMARLSIQAQKSPAGKAYRTDADGILAQLKSVVVTALSTPATQHDTIVYVKHGVTSVLDNLRGALRGAAAATPSAPPPPMLGSQVTAFTAGSAFAAAGWDELAICVSSAAQRAIIEAATAAVLRALLDDFTATTLREVEGAMLERDAAAKEKGEDDGGGDELVFYD